MKIGLHPNMTRNLGAPRDWNHSKIPCYSLPVADVMTESGPAMESMWVPTEEELAALNAGVPIILIVSGTVHPPVSLTVAAEPMEV